ncbi:MAG: aldo/keto reductase family protein [Candidatus Latescibacteria bacterium]|jgi:aryl-alcohol dehydrogenase-like predicted oxidoreductase|nr:aldo/keto reductase family protein [Candidatus Latescibacterota bacterium]
MQYRKMGKWGVKLSAIGLGSYLTIGYKIDDKTSRNTIRTAYDGGINFFDTADAYNKGEAEKVLGKYLAEYDRDSLFILTKCWLNITGHVNGGGLSAKHIFEACHASLKRLKTDYIDLYMCHRPDPDTPIEETVRALEDLARQGKIIYWGVSEWPAHHIVRANRIAREIGARPIGISEPRYNLLYRYPERNLFPTTEAEGIGNVVFSSLAHGMLTGKYKPGEQAPADTRAADDDTSTVIKKLYWTEEDKKKALELVRIASDMGVTAAQLAIAWCLKNPAVTSVITGATRVSQVEDNLKAVEITIPDDVSEKLDELYPPPETVECEH